MTASNASVSAAAPERAPSVLVVLAVRDAAEWLRECLQALAAQTYPRLGILAIDDASTDGSREILAQALGEGRVIRHERRLGLSRSFAEAVAHPVAAGADFVLLLHDDAALDPEAVTRLVEATTLEGAERVGIVGAKVVDWDHPRRLRDVGRSADRFGHPYSPLQDDEIDQGQFDRVLEVLSVDSCAMLVARDVWRTTGLFDERLGDEDGDLDLCWRVRLAGWSVLMTPLARVRHAAAAERDDRVGQRSRRYEEDRAALASVLKNDGRATLVWVVPLGGLLSLVRLLYLTLSRRFEEAYDLLAAIGWNITHLPGTLVARRSVQKHRRVRDRELRRFTESAGLRLPRWFMTAERILEEQRELEVQDLDDRTTARLRHRTVSFVSAHPVIVGSFLGIIVAALSFRGVFSSGRLYGGAIPTFPTYPSGFFAELISAYRTTPLGGSLAASPALAAMGGLSTVLFGSTSLAQKVMVAGGPVMAAVLCYRATSRLTARPGPSVVAAAAYGLSAIVLSAFSEGRIALLVVLAVLPALAERVEVAFGPEEPPDGRRWRLVAGLGVTIAVGVAFVPGVLLAVAVMTMVQLVAGTARRRGALVVGLAVIGAAILTFPFVPTLLAGGGSALGSELGTNDPWRLLRLTFDGGPATWAPALFLPVAAILGFALSRGERRRPAIRASIVAVVGLALSWLSSAGYLPAALTNAPVYLAMSATAEAFLVAFGLASALGGLEREAFGFRQVGTALLTVTLAGGIFLQAIGAMTAEWAIGGPDRIPAAWAVVDSSSKGAFRVLWIGDDDGRSFPAPGGDPQGIVEAGPATLRYGLTMRVGAVAIDTARPMVGPGVVSMREALAEILSGTTIHGGALLAPFGIRYLVANEDEVSADARARLDAQVDLDVVPQAGLAIWSNAVDLPPASVVQADPRTARIIASGRPVDLQRLAAPRATPLTQVEGGWSGPSGDGNLAVVSTEFDGAWELSGHPSAPTTAFGWATSFPVATGTVDIRYGAQLPSTVAAWLLAAVWAAALWITRKPVAR